LLSGIGARENLAPHGIAMRAELPAVGRNLQDRYEVGVINRMAKPWSALQGAEFTRTDPLFAEWAKCRSGMYCSNGAVLAASLASPSATAVPDLFCMALLVPFRGYYPGYAREMMGRHNYLTWAILKAYTSNRAGTVTLRSADPRDTPIVDFHYFEEGNGDAKDDLQAMVEGIRFVRRIAASLIADGTIAEEESPCANLQTDEELAEFVRYNAWGHHASCSCAVGPPATGVIDSSLRVHFTQGLRVVDASIFPRIPGYFITSAIYLAAEKAAQTILEQARSSE
jgi:choline dehydrogenase-like flavoprotein